jgi:alkaline phosphatase D
MKHLAGIMIVLYLFSAVYAQTETYDRILLDPAYEPFYHGVASGDPLPDRVIIWTRITTANSSENIDWEMATDKNFSSIVNSGTVVTDSSKDYTVKVDVNGLQPNTWYYYRFKGHGVYSITGRTRTAPASAVNNLRFAVVSCSNLSSGYFHVYRDIVNKNEADVILHLGDYIYEYKSNSAVPDDTTRKSSPDKEILTLADYRMRHSQYKLDADLRDCHRNFPFIAVWDDHETANNSWRDGAENHTQGVEGSWQDRKSFGRKAYFEWMPIREQTPNNDSMIYRTIRYGNLADLIMIDTRLIDRDEQVQGAVIQLNNNTLNDTNRSMLGITQRNWLNNELKTSAARWKIIGNQVMVAPLVVFGFSIANADQWDGYPHDRKVVFENILNNNVENVVFLTGDIHTSWANDLPLNRSTYNSGTGAGSVGVEFVCTSITSSSGNLPITAATIQSSNPHMKYVDLSRRGYVVLDLNTQRAQGDFVHVTDITRREFTSSVSASWFVNSGERFLRQASSTLASKNGMPDVLLSNANNNLQSKNNLVSIICYPNPFINEIQIQYYLYKSEPVTATLLDSKGKQMALFTVPGNTKGLHEVTLRLDNLSPGNYTLLLTSPGGKISRQIVKVDSK